MFIFQITFCRSVSGTKILLELEKGCAGWDILVLTALQQLLAPPLCCLSLGLAASAPPVSGRRLACPSVTGSPR